MADYGLTWTTAELIEEVRDEAAIPSLSRFTPEKILTFADMAIRSIPSEVITTNLGLSGRALDYDDVLLSSGMRDGSEFLVPPAAAGGNISHIDYHRTADPAVEPQRLFPVAAAEATEVIRPDQSGPGWWHFRDGRIVLVPTPTTGLPEARIRIYFPRVHPRLVLASEVVSFVSAAPGASPGTFDITVDVTPPASWLTADRIDLYADTSPHAVLAPRMVYTVSPPFTVIVQPKLDGNDDLLFLTSGRISAAGTSDAVQLPESMRKAVTSRTASFIVRTLGDEARANAFWGVSKEEFQSVRNTLAPRQKVDKIVYINRRSVLRRGRWR